ncbi:hypothetical protein HOS54_gp210 [Klebsiella phage Menlow]|uniref:Uncharacterized protein n=1 Tax=Klebsiella phage Menlow TaxID=2054273 RepID=A0A2H5BN41_9CAUD|nr:hypothetical protein HOS54_gp210 [Klebsiella phage Menlow]AUG87739.1 hypothetical protein CPT_Menlow_038 [Klebsiella phage Menlow]
MARLLLSSSWCPPVSGMCRHRNLQGVVFLTQRSLKFTNRSALTQQLWPNILLSSTGLAVHFVDQPLGLR